MRALVTGAGGFVGQHLVSALRDARWEAIAAGGPTDEGVDVRLDIRDREAVDDVVTQANCDAVFHLAAQSFVPDALREPEKTYEINVTGTAHLAGAVRRLARRRRSDHVRVLFVSSAEAYGTYDAADLPLRESLTLRPRNPYGASKVAAEAILLGECRSFGLDVVIARGFNQIGPSQGAKFAIADFAAGIARIAAGGDPVLRVGNLDAERDFLDVRDAVQAYVLLAQRGAAGEIYNVCSGRALSVRAVLGELIRIARVPVEVRTDPARLRPAEIPVTFGTNRKLVECTSWSERHTLTQTLRDIYEDARKHAAHAR